MIASAVGLALIPILTLRFGAIGAVWGLAAQSLTLALASHITFRRALALSQAAAR